MHYRPEELSDSPILITSSDPAMRSAADTEPVTTMQRAIKAHCILGGSVTLPSEIILSDEVTSKAVLGMPELLKEGLLVPDLPADLSSFQDFVKRNSILSSRSLEQQFETAAFLDAKSKRAIAYTSVETSKAYGRNLLRWLVLAKVQKSVDIRWSALRGFAEKWMSLPALGTEELENCRRKIKSGRSLFDQNAVLLYHLIGAAVTGSSPLLPESMDPALRALLESLNRNEAGWESLAASVDVNNREDLTKILAAVSPGETVVSARGSTEALVGATAAQFALIELLDAFEIQSSILDRLGAAEVAEIAASSEAQRARQTIRDAYREVSDQRDATRILKLSATNTAAVKADFRNKIRRVIRGEAKRGRRLTRLTSTIGWGSVAVGFATLPFTGGVGLAMSVGGALLSLSGSSLDSWSRLYSKPMLTLLERIQFAHP